MGKEALILQVEDSHDRRFKQYNPDRFLPACMHACTYASRICPYGHGLRTLTAYYILKLSSAGEFRGKELRIGRSLLTFGIKIYIIYECAAAAAAALLLGRVLWLLASSASSLV